MLSKTSNGYHAAASGRAATSAVGGRAPAAPGRRGFQGDVGLDTRDEWARTVQTSTLNEFELSTGIDSGATRPDPFARRGADWAIQVAQYGAAPVWPLRAAPAAVTTRMLVQQSQRGQPSRHPEAAATPMQRATIEIVALLFQNILTEERLHPGVRVWFARLQIPVIRVAIMEPEDFAAVDHPARRLIDRMGACVMGLGRSLALGESLEQEVRRIVHVVEAYPDSGGRVFQTVLDEFERFLGDGPKEACEEPDPGISLAQQLEQREAMAIQYSIELRKMLESVPVQEEIRRFLFETWADVLATAGLTYGISSQEARAMKSVAGDLIWSASAKVTREERASVLRKLPALMKALREGMTTAGIDPSQQDRFIKTLNDSLAAGFTAKAAAISPKQLDALKAQLNTLEEVMTDTGLLALSEGQGHHTAGLVGGELQDTQPPRRASTSGMVRGEMSSSSSLDLDGSSQILALREELRRLPD